MTSLLVPLAFAWAVAAVVMLVVWVVQVRTGEAGIVDVAWTLLTGCMAAVFALTADGAGGRQIVIASLVSLWSLRLATHLALRLRRIKDGRYDQLKEDWGENAALRLFAFDQIQAATVPAFAMSALIAARNPQPLGGLDALAAALWLGSLAAEALADRQLNRFRADPANKGKVCDVGLWRYSRHPNYFFEWLHWWAYPLFAIGADFAWLTILPPLAMLYFLLYVTGIPPTEAQSLRSKGDAYRRYQREVSAFVPWFRRTS